MSKRALEFTLPPLLSILKGLCNYLWSGSGGIDLRQDIFSHIGSNHDQKTFCVNLLCVQKESVMLCDNKIILNLLSVSWE